MHTGNKHTHKTGGSGMPMNGGDWRSGPIPHGGTREEGMGVPTGAWATILPRVANGKKTANQKEEQETSKEKRKQRGNSQTKALTTVGLQYQTNSQKEQNRKRKNRTKPAETTRATNTANTSNRHHTIDTIHVLFSDASGMSANHRRPLDMHSFWS